MEMNLIGIKLGLICKIQNHIQACIVCALYSTLSLSTGDQETNLILYSFKHN